MKWEIHIDRDFVDDLEIESYSITLNKKWGGWNTDSGYEGYGLPKELAIWICDILNQSDEKPPYEMDKYGSWVKKCQELE
jgi:hypothetical protein